jgi:hypothetical protein
MQHVKNYLKKILALWLGIGLIESVTNKDRKFGSVGKYYRVTVIDANGTQRRLLLTDNDLITVTERANKNPEDFECMCS